ncbi:50S ribosomal L9 C-terminal domain-containing protein, partial [Campylobacter jejuni]
VTKDEIAHALKEQSHIEIDKKSLECDTLKSLGIHEVSVKLGHAIHAKFNINIKAE